MTKFLEKFEKPLCLAVLGPFYPFLGKKRNFFKNWALEIFKIYNYLPSHKKSEKTDDQLPWKTSSWLTDRPTDRLTEGQTKGKTMVIS